MVTENFSNLHLRDSMLVIVYLQRFTIKDKSDLLTLNFTPRKFSQLKPVNSFYSFYLSSYLGVVLDEEALFMIYGVSA